MKKSELAKLIKEEILAEAKKDKTGLSFALAANIEKYGKPQTPKGAKPVDFTKKQEKKVKKTAEKLKKSIKEVTTTILYDGKKLAIDSESLKRLKAGKDVVGNNIDKNGQEEWILAKGDWKISDLKEDLGNYMFFQNLKSIKQMVDEMLELDEKMVDGILASGHDWAEDHIATSKDDVEEVHNFLMSKKVVGPVGMDEKKLSPKQKKIAAAAPPEDEITGADFKALKKK